MPTFSKILLIKKGVIAMSRVFKALEDVRKQCISLASPLYELTTEQSDAKMKILEKINEALDNEKPEHTLLVVYGGAGTGKTVLISAL